LANEIDHLLASARAALDGTLAVPPARATRTAALLGRMALEHIVSDDCARVGVETRPTMRTKLICVRVLLDAERGQLASVAWAGLSNACHRHAYELAPTAGEVAHLLDMVESLQGRPPPAT
jgi:hypothetical protein